MKHLILPSILLLAGSLLADDFVTSPIGPPPAGEVERLGLNPFYEQYLSYEGFPIVASKKVSDYALREAAYLIDQMLGEREDVLEAMIENKVRLAIMAPGEFTTDIPEHATLEPKAYWDKRARGLGASRERPAVSVGEENLLGFRGDPYSTESIMVHEFAHAIHLMGLNSVDPDFQKQLEKVFNRAGLKGLWRGKYAGTNPSEYWAEAVQSWFDTNREDDHDHNHVDTREELKEHDPEVASLVESIFGGNDWRYSYPRERTDDPHLAGFDVKAAPVFAWPKDLVEAYEALDRGEDRELISLEPVRLLPKDPSSGESGKSISLRFDNESDQVVSTFWIGFDGLRRHYADIDPKRRHEQQTYGNHFWVVTGEDGKDLGWFEAPEKDGRVVIK
ncbi:MAG: hypothetical protein P1U87_17400 [Verrucomicrobiales bacterium]|nr:hypothetical protein [Verrucomicrobiales bacterium]